MAEVAPRESDGSPGAPSDAVVFVGISLVLGIASRHVLRGTRVPYTVALLIIGIVMGSLEYGTSHGLGKIGAGIRLWANINPDLLLAVFLPALLFESSFSMEVHQIKRCIGQMLLLAGPGVLISTFCLGTLLKVSFPYGWTWKTSLLLGGLLSATDPVAVVALLKELGASKKLNTIIEGESLMNDGTAIVVYTLFYKMALGRSFSPGEIIKFLSQVSLGAVAVGVAFGIASVLWLGFIFNDTVIEITLTLAVSYIAYFTAQDAAEVSGVLTVMTLGMFYAAVARTAFKGDGQESLHHFWEMVAYIANTLIFILSGVVIAEDILNNYDHFQGHGSSWGYLILLYVFVQCSRVIVVSILYPFLRYFGYGLEWREAIILVWSGLRGAVALSLSLSVNQASGKHTKSDLTPEVGTLFVFFTGGIVFLTLIVNGSTTQFVLRLLGMDKLSETKVASVNILIATYLFSLQTVIIMSQKRILNYTRYEMLNKALEAFGDLGDDEELGPADWPTVQRYITCLNDLDEEQVHPHIVTESEHHLEATHLKDIRIRLLNGVQAAYWGMLEEGRITQSTASLLMRSVDEAMDVVSSEPLCDWKGLKSNVHFPSYYKFLQMSRLPRRLVTYFTVERLESACYICAAFLRAHRIARRQLHDFIGESDIATIVINESKDEGEEASKFLEDVRVAFPQVLRVVKTKQVTYSILNHLSNYVQNLEKVGLLEEREMIHLDDAVQTDLKRLLRNPPLVKMPKASHVLRTHPLLGALPSAICDPIASSTKEIIKIRGVTLYKEGSKPNGIWIIAVGVVKWSSKTFPKKHSLHPTFSHGSTLGLYEVLLGKPYMCDIITDSVVHCFFLETEKVQSLLASDPSVEDFLWQESTIILAKILLPRKFEEMSMHDLRALVSERSTMHVYLRGEVVEIKPNSIGFLLEGFIKAQDPHPELITSPAALLSHVDTSVSDIESSGTKTASFCHSGYSYQIETRARVIIFDIGPTGNDAQLSKRSIPRLSSAMEPARSHFREHEGLVSWPESFFKLTQHQNDTGADKQPLSAKAAELSIYGSMMNGVRRQYKSFRSFRSFKMPNDGENSHSMSFPRVQPPDSRPLLSVQSEGSVNRKLGSKEYAKLPSFLPLPSRRKKVKIGEGNSSDESGGEEVIVRIDSPSTLSFSQDGSQNF